MNRGTLGILGATVGVCLVGALLLKGIGHNAPVDRTASVDNGSPYGLLAARRVLEHSGVSVATRVSFAAPLDVAPGGLLVIPPPAGSAWSKPEAEAVAARVLEGRHDLLVLCDEDPRRNARLAALFEVMGVGCAPPEREVTTSDEVERPPPASESAQSEGRAQLASLPGPLRLRGRMALEVEERAAFVPLYLDENDDAMVGTVAMGKGRARVVAKLDLFVNDGIGEGVNAALWLTLTGGYRHVLFDEAHHGLRSEEVLSAAFGGTGPRAGFLALLLLLPLSMLALIPRRGDPPRHHDVKESPAARAQVMALASLYKAAGAKDPASSREE